MITDSKKKDLLIKVKPKNEKSSKNLNSQKWTRQKDHRNVKIFAPVKVIKGKARMCFAVARLYRGHVVNIQKIQNSDSEFFVNSLCDFKC